MLSKDLYLSRERYLVALKRMRALLVRGLRLRYEDSNEIGNKYNYCTWGLCSESKEAWPDAEDHLWPDEFVLWGRGAPKYLHGLRCPLQDMKRHNEGNGCFWSCMIFSTGSGEKPSKETVIQLYDRLIEQVEASQRNGEG